MMTKPELKHRGISAFLIDTRYCPGFSRGKKEPKLGIRASATSELLFEDCRMPASSAIGPGRRGLQDRHDRAGRRSHWHCVTGARHCRSGL